MRFFPVWLVVAGLAGGQTSFEGPREISDFHGNPWFTQAVDMDGDNDLDVISAQSSAGSRVLWWANDGSGGFGPRHDWEWLWNSSVLALADYNGDGRLDVWLVKNRAGWGALEELWVATGVPGGTFDTPVKCWTAPKAEFTFGAVRDLNGDGRGDLVFDSKAVIQQPDGCFQPLAIVPTSEFYYTQMEESNFTHRWTIGSFGGIGIRQVLWGGGSGDSEIRNSPILADGMYGASKLAFSLRAGERAEGLLRIPPQAEGDLDRLVLLSGRFVDAKWVREAGLLEFGPDGTASKVKSVRLPDDASSASTAVWQPTTERLLMEALPSRRVARFFALHFDGAGETSNLFECTPEVVRPGLADLDGDGVPDLLLPGTSLGDAIGGFLDHLTWRRGLANGGYASERRDINQPMMASHLVFAGDVDADGDGDVMTTGGYVSGPWIQSDANELVFWENVGPTFKRHEIYGRHDFIEVVSVKDRNGDGRVDVLVHVFDFNQPGPPGTNWVSNVDRLVLLRQLPGGNFQPIVLGEDFGKENRDSYFGEIDWDGDGLDDLLVSRDEPGWSFCGFRKRTGPESWGNPVPLLYNGGWWLRPLMQDMDFDGDPDWCGTGIFYPAAENGDGSIEHWAENDGNGNIVSVHKLPAVMRPLGGDLDGDGHHDFMADDGYYLSRPGGSLIRHPVDLSDWRLASAALLDIDQDGDDDLLASHVDLVDPSVYSLQWVENRRVGTGGSQVFLSDGAMKSGPFNCLAPPRAVGQQPRNGLEAALADIDADGTLDLVVVWRPAWLGNSRVEWFRGLRRQAPTQFDAWMAARGLAGSSAGPQADWDGDGATNWSEFAFGTDPAAAGNSSDTALHLTANDDGWNLVFKRRTDAASAGLLYQIQRSGDMVDWWNWTPVVEVGFRGDGYEDVKIRVAPDQAREFFRIAVTGP